MINVWRHAKSRDAPNKGISGGFLAYASDNKKQSFDSIKKRRTTTSGENWNNATTCFWIMRWKYSVLIGQLEVNKGTSTSQATVFLINQKRVMLRIPRRKKINLERSCKWTSWSSQASVLCSLKILLTKKNVRIRTYTFFNLLEFGINISILRQIWYMIKRNDANQKVPYS